MKQPNSRVLMSSSGRRGNADGCTVINKDQPLPNSNQWPRGASIPNRRTRCNDHPWPHEFQIQMAPPFAAINFAGVGLLVIAPLAERDVVEMLDRVGGVEAVEATPKVRAAYICRTYLPD
jgi:hypothetical protein